MALFHVEHEADHCRASEVFHVEQSSEAAGSSSLILAIHQPKQK